jgi:hypothetical protein
MFQYHRYPFGNMKQNVQKYIEQRIKLSFWIKCTLSRTTRRLETLDGDGQNDPSGIQ